MPTMASSSQALLQPSHKRQRRQYTQNDSQSTNHGVVSPLRPEIESQEDENQSQQHALVPPPQLSPRQVTIQRIERIVACILESLDDGEPPVLNAREFSDDNPAPSKRFHNVAQCRNFTSILLVLSFCHSLLRSNRTTSTREVYYAFVAHFHHQKECDAAIAQAAALLHVPRLQLGLTASPKGWFCGSLEIVHPNGTVVDASSLSTVQGLPITREWLDRSNNRSSDGIQLRTSAECILVIEKEGIYTRLSEDRFFEHHVPSILVCGKGVPDLATRSLVHQLHLEFPHLPVYGLCDCNPYGLVVLQTYARGSTKLGVDGGLRYSVPIQWIGLMPSHVEELRDELPRDVLQALSGHDKKKLQHLLNSNSDPSFQYELQLMQQQDFKCEMEALHWNGMDFFCGWLEDLLWDYLDNDDGEDDDSSMEE